MEIPRLAVFGSAPISVPVFEAIRQHCQVPIAVISEEPTVRHGKVVLNPVQTWQTLMASLSSMEPQYHPNR